MRAPILGLLHGVPRFLFCFFSLFVYLRDVRVRDLLTMCCFSFLPPLNGISYCSFRTNGTWTIFTSHPRRDDMVYVRVRPLYPVLVIRPHPSLYDFNSFPYFLNRRSCGFALSLSHLSGSWYIIVLSWVNLLVPPLSHHHYFGRHIDPTPTIDQTNKSTTTMIAPMTKKHVNVFSFWRIGKFYLLCFCVGWGITCLLFPPPFPRTMDFSMMG